MSLLFILQSRLSVRMGRTPFSNRQQSVLEKLRKTPNAQHFDVLVGKSSIKILNMIHWPLKISMPFQNEWNLRAQTDKHFYQFTLFIGWREWWFRAGRQQFYIEWDMSVFQLSSRLLKLSFSPLSISYKSSLLDWEWKNCPENNHNAISDKFLMLTPRLLNSLMKFSIFNLLHFLVCALRDSERRRLWRLVSISQMA